MTADARLVLVAGALLAAGVVAGLIADRLRLPALVLFLGVGMAIGSENIPHSLEFFNIAFFAVLISTLIQGSTVVPLARRLRVSSE